MKTKTFLLTLLGTLLWGGCTSSNSIDDVLSSVGGTTTTSPSSSATTDTSGDDLEEFTIVIDSSDDDNYTEVEEVVPTDDSDDEYNDYIENSTFSTTVTVAYNGTSATVTGAPDGVTVSQDGAYVTITSTVKNIEYQLTGSTTSGSFKIYSDNKFQLTLDGVSVTSTQGAAINIQSSKRVFVVCNSGTTNTLVDNSSYTSTPSDEDEKACFFSEGQLIFSGTGALSVTGNYKHGICSDDYLYFRSGCNVTVEDAVKDGIHTNDKIIVSGGTLDITADSDGMECEEGYIELRAGEVTVNSGDDAIVASYEDSDTSITPYIGMYGGLVKVTTTDEKGMGLKATGDITVSGGVLQAQVSGAGSKGISCDGDLQIVGGKVVAITSGGTVYEDNDLTSAAGIKCDGNLTISGATVALKSTGAAGKGINCDGTITITSGTVKVITTGTQSVYGSLDSSAKGIKGDGNVTISGGLVMVRTSGGEGSEGIESKSTLTINDGEVEVSAYDDCLNASKNITLNGGDIYCYSSTNDAIDSNGTLTITGGTIVAVGAGTPEGGIDSDNNTFTITGGTLVSIGGDTSTPTTSKCTQPSIIYGGSGTSGKYLGLKNSSGGTVLAYLIPRTYSSMSLLVTSPNLTKGSTYTLYSGGSVSGGTNYHGLITGTTYSDGSSLSSITLSSMVTTVGSSSSSSGNMGGGFGR